MTNQKNKSRLRSLFRWIFWVVLVQFLLINISAALYAYKFTHLYSPSQKETDMARPVSENILSKTWRLFTGAKYYKTPVIGLPSFEYKTVQLKTKKGIPVEAWCSHTDSLSKGTVILFHGLTGNKSLVLVQANEFLRWGYNVMLVDARAHGNSGGSTTTIGFREAEEVNLAYEYVKQRGAKTIFLWGLSVGAVEIIKAVADFGIHPAGILLEMPFGSLEAHIKARISNIGFPGQPFGALVTFWIGMERGFNGLGFDLYDYAHKIDVPVLLQYGSNDGLVSREEVDGIYRALPSVNKKLVVYDQGGHTSLLNIDPAMWRNEVGQFLSKYEIGLNN
jgi:uncharacterized protein